MEEDLHQEPKAPVLKAFEAMSCGGILLDEKGRVLLVNLCAQRLLGDGLAAQGGRLAATDRGADAAFQTLLRTALGLRSPLRKSAVALPRSVEHPLVVRALPIASADAPRWNAGRVLVLLVDPDDCPPPTRDVLQEIFGLTSAETRVASLLMCGSSLEEIARTNQTEIGTVRQQVKSILAKTQTRRQGELVALLTRLTMAFALQSCVHSGPVAAAGKAEPDPVTQP